MSSWVTSGIDHRHTDLDASSSIQLSIGMISLILLRAFPGEDGRAPEFKMLAKC